MVTSESYGRPTSQKTLSHMAEVPGYNSREGRFLKPTLACSFVRNAFF